MINHKAWRMHVWRFAKSLVLYLFLLQLPLTVWPACTGMIHGFLFAKFMNDLDDQAAWNWKLDLEKDSGVHPWLMNSPRPPYHVPALRSTQWTRQLGFLRSKHASSAISLGAFDHLLSMQSMQVQWVYLGGYSESPFDDAFDRLLQYHYAHHPANNATFMDVDTNIAPFLNCVWRVKRPAILRLSVEQLYTQDQEDSRDKPDTAGPYHSHTPLPVTVHVAELPLPFTVLPPGHFPTPFSQLLSLTSGAVDPSVLPEWNFMHQSIHRFNEHYRALVSQSAALHAIDATDDWIDGHLPMLNSGTVHHIAAQLSTVVAILPLAMHYSVLVPAWRWFTGQDDMVDVPQKPMEPVVLGNMESGKWTRHPLLNSDFAEMVEERMMGG